MTENRTSLLRRNSGLRALVASRLVSSAGTWLAYIALTVDVYLRTRSSVWVSAVLLAGFLPTVAVAALAGPWLDRLPRRTFLVAAELGAGIVFVALPFAPSAAAVVSLAVCAGFASAVFYPTARATLPKLVAEDELSRANSLSQTAGTSGMAAGPVLAGLLVAATGVDAIYALNAASFAISAVLLTRLPALAPEGATRTGDDAPGYWQTAAQSIRLYAESTVLRTVLRVWVLASLGGALINVGEIFLARQTFHAGTFGFGLLASASGSGIVAGSALAGRFNAGTAAQACRLGLAGGALGFGGAALAPSIWVAAACALVGGIGNAIFMASSTLLVLRSTDDAIRGHAFAIFDSAGFVALGAGMAGGGVLIGLLGARGAWLAAAGLVAVALAGTFGRTTTARPLRAEPEPS